MTSYSPPIPVTADQNSDAFDSGKPMLDNWLRNHALNNEGRASRSYVVTAEDPSRVVAYYSLATGSVALSEIRGKFRHNLPDPVPTMILGRLAVDHKHAGHGLGKGMLLEAMQRTLEISRVAGVRMLMVHAIDDEAVAFYRRFGFHAFPAGGRTLFLPLETITAALEV